MTRESFRLSRRGCLAGLITLAAAAHGGAQPPVLPKINAALANQLRFLSFRVTSGRVTASTDDPTRNFTTSGKQGDTTEKLVVTFNVPQVTVEYSHATPQVAHYWNIVDGREVIVRRDPLRFTSALPLLFVQPRERTLQLILGTGPEERSWLSPTLWQLYLAAPDAAREHLFPLLELLRPEWRLLDTAQEIERRLLAWEGPPPSIDQRRVAGLVSDLGDSSFARRRAAERDLAGLGPAAIPLLTRHLDDSLDAEQRLRLRRALAQVGSQEPEDTPAGAAAWLAGDVRSWLILLERIDEADRRAAWDRLRTLPGVTAPFDPAASAEVRRDQLRALRNQLQIESSPQP